MADISLIQVELDGIAVPDLIVGSDMRRFLIQAAQADVEVLVVPQEEELPASVEEIRMADMDGRDECPVPLIELTVEFDRLRRLRYQADDRLLLSGSSAGSKKNDENGYLPRLRHVAILLTSGSTPANLSPADAECHVHCPLHRRSRMFPESVLQAPDPGIT